MHLRLEEAYRRQQAAGIRAQDVLREVKDLDARLTGLESQCHTVNGQHRTLEMRIAASQSEVTSLSKH